MAGRLYVGLMSGTSADGIDAALVRFAPRPDLLCAQTTPLPAELRMRLRGITAATPLAELARLDSELAELFASCTLALLSAAGVDPGAVHAIGSHGQTVWHEPGGSPPFTLQIGDPSLISERTGITTVADFRRRDLAAGGQGAPLVPAFHAEVFSHANETRCIVNLGGIANVTVLPAGGAEVIGYDTGPANTLLDAWIGRHLGRRYDASGRWAASGVAIPELLAKLLADPYFERPPPKSTGPEHFNLDWLEARLIPGLAAHDVQATLVELSAAAMAAAILESAPETARVLVCGGGANNPVLMSALAARLPEVAVESTAAHGVSPDYVEACAFAWLARRTLRSQPGNLPAVTGACRPAVLGGIYPGLKGL